MCQQTLRSLSFAYPRSKGITIKQIKWRRKGITFAFSKFKPDLKNHVSIKKKVEREKHRNQTEPKSNKKSNPSWNQWNLKEVGPSSWLGPTTLRGKEVIWTYNNFLYVFLVKLENNINLWNLLYNYFQNLELLNICMKNSKLLHKEFKLINLLKGNNSFYMFFHWIKNFASLFFKILIIIIFLTLYIRACLLNVKPWIRVECKN